MTKEKADPLSEFLCSPGGTFHLLPSDEEEDEEVVVIEETLPSIVNNFPALKRSPLMFPSLVPTGYRQTNWYFHGTFGSFNACIFMNRQILPNNADKTQVLYLSRQEPYAHFHIG